LTIENKEGERGQNARDGDAMERQRRIERRKYEGISG